jgi:putative acetyltransferase
MQPPKGTDVQDDASSHTVTTFDQAASESDIATARELFEEYAAWLGFSLSFQDFAQELATLPGQYAPPSGRLLLARHGGVVAGCGAPSRVRACAR